MRSYCCGLIVLFIGSVFIWCSVRDGAIGTNPAKDAARPHKTGKSGWEFTPPAATAQPVTAELRLPGIYPAGSRVNDDKTPGGFGPSNNWPKMLGAKTWGKKGAISLVAFPNTPIAYFKHRGIGLRLINRTTKPAAFTACDSRLYIVQEALDKDGQWREIEDPPCPICYRSYHRVFLKPKQYWEFKARTYAGPIKTKIRFRLDPTGVQDKAKPIYSNEFDGQVAKIQFRPGPSRAMVRRAFRSNDSKEKGVVATLAEVVGNEALTVPRTVVNPRSAVLHLAGFGPGANAALPALRKAMQGKDICLRATAAYAVWRIEGKLEAPLKTLIAVLDADDDDTGSHWEAAIWLGKMGPAANRAVPSLCNVLANGDEEHRYKAAEALAAIRSRPDVAVPSLIQALSDPDWYTRSGVAQALGEFGAEAKRAIPQLTAALKDKDGHVRVAAAFALWRIEKKAEPAVKTLTRLLTKDADDYSPESAAETLGKIGPAAKDAIPQLTAVLRNDNRGMRISAAGALWKITRQTEPGLPVLIAAIRDGESPSESDTHHAIGILEEMGPKAKAAVPALRAALKRAQEEWAREMVERVLTKIAPAAARRIGR